MEFFGPNGIATIFHRCQPGYASRTGVASLRKNGRLMGLVPLFLYLAKHKKPSFIVAIQPGL